MDKIYYAWLNDKPVKKFSISENGSIQTVFKQFLKYVGTKLNGNIEKINDESYLGKAYFTNGTDKIELKKETGMEDLLRINTEAVKRKLKKLEKMNFNDTELGRYINSQIELIK